MRIRFFLTLYSGILLACIIAGVAVLIVMRDSRRSIVNQSIEASAATIAIANFGHINLEDAQAIEDSILEAFGDRPVDDYIALYSVDGKKLWSNQSSSPQVPGYFPLNVGLLTYRGKDMDYRVANLRIQGQPLVLQIAQSFDDRLLPAKLWTLRNALLFCLVLGALALLSLALTRFTLHPVRSLTDYVAATAQHLKEGRSLGKSDFPNAHPSSRDPYNKLICELGLLIDEVFNERELQKRGLSLLAHELKTPLHRMRIELSESNPRVVVEIDRLATQIQSYLEMTHRLLKLEERHIDVVQVQPLLKEVLSSLGPSEQARVFVRGSDFRVFFDREIIKQVLFNIVSNALLHSSGGVEIECSKGSIKIFDEGAGLPKGIQENLGNPFNKGPHSQGHGLGIAFSIAALKAGGARLEYRFEGGRHCANLLLKS